jgi:hypothetical protein
MPAKADRAVFSLVRHGLRTGTAYTAPPGRLRCDGARVQLRAVHGACTDAVRTDGRALVEEDVLGLEVAVDDVHRVQVLLRYTYIHTYIHTYIITIIIIIIIYREMMSIECRYSCARGEGEGGRRREGGRRSMAVLISGVREHRASAHACCRNKSV